MSFYHRVLRDCRISIKERKVSVGPDGKLYGDLSPEEKEILVRSGQFYEVSEPPEGYTLSLNEYIVGDIVAT